MVALATVVLAACAAAPAGAADDPLAALKESCEARTSADERPVAYRLCSAKVASFDGTPLDVTVTLPARQPRGRKLPLVMMLHGLFSSKAEYLSETRAGDGPDRGQDGHKTSRWNNVWFASRGYAVLNYSARAHGESGGELGLADRNVEVRDARHLSSLLADDAFAPRPLATIDRGRVAAVGGSYGGGQTWLLLTTRENEHVQYGTWRTPRGKLVRLAAVVPSYTWTDLLYTLAPNGRQLADEVVDPRTANLPFGVGKQTVVNGFVASGGSKLTPQVYTWLTRFNAGEPYDDPDDPVVPQARRGLSEDRSAYYQDGWFDALRARRQRRVPVLAAQGWTDPIFHAIEAVRMYRRLRDAAPGYPIQLYLGDFEHLTTANRPSDFLRFHDLGNRLIDRYLRRPKPRDRRPPRIRFDAQTAVTRCDPDGFGPVVRAPSWDALAPARATFELDGPRQTASPIADRRGATTDPVPVSVQRGRGCITTSLDPTPAVASWLLPVESDLLTIGMPRLRLRFRATGPDVQLNSRLWDVAPGGEQTLVSRGAYRVLAPDPEGQTAEYELFGNAWRFAAGHRLLLEVTQDDSTYFRRDNFPSSTTIESGQLVLPVRE